MNEVINVTRSSMPPFEEYCAEIRDIWDSRWLTNMGVKHQALEAAMKDYLKTPHVTLFSNGHLALENIIEAFELKGEIITTPFTFASTTHAIVRCGCTPVFCDINPVDYTIDVDKIEQLITEKTVAIMPVHVYGNLCDVQRIADIARRHNLKVIYDAAHAFGVTKDGVSSANFGDASMFSFHATKVFHTIEGGAMCYADPALAEFSRQSRPARQLLRNAGGVREKFCPQCAGRYRAYRQCLSISGFRRHLQRHRSVMRYSRFHHVASCQFHRRRYGR